MRVFNSFWIWIMGPLSAVLIAGQPKHDDQAEEKRYRDRASCSKHCLGKYKGDVKNSLHYYDTVCSRKCRVGRR